MAFDNFKPEKRSLLLGAKVQVQDYKPTQRSLWRRVVATTLVGLAAVLTIHATRRQCARYWTTDPVATAQQCSIENVKADLSFLDSAVPIQTTEFLERRDRLARALVANGVNAFALEPGYTFQ